MRQPSSIEPFSPSPTVTLHPALQAALDNLDVQIEEELVRYRRQRRYPTAVTRKKPFAPQPSDGSAIGILKNKIQLPTPRSSIYDPLPYQSASPPQGTTQPLATYPEVAPVELPVESPHAEIGSINPSAAAMATAAFAASEPSEPSRIESYARQHDLSAYAPNAVLQKLIHQPDAETSIPEDYLASSEELLRSIAEEDPELRADREPNSLLDTLLTPLGVGSMLLLLLSSTTLGYMIMNPSSLGFGNGNEAGSPLANPSPAGSASTLAPSPDLASEEFPDLNLDTLSTLPKPAAQGSPASGSKSPKAVKPGNTSGQTTTQPTVSSAGSADLPASTNAALPVPESQPKLSTVYVPANPPVVSAPKPASPPLPPAPAPATISPEPISAAPPLVEPALDTPDPPAVATAPLSESNLSGSNEASVNQPRYYVVTEYSGDTSLQQARSAVPDAYVRNLPSEGAKVQLGAFSDQAKAQELQQQLQDRGIEAEVYQP